MTFRQYRKEMQKRTERAKTLKMLEKEEALLAKKINDYINEATAAKRSGNEIKCKSYIPLIKNASVQLAQTEDMLINYKMALDMIEMKSLSESFIKQMDSVMKDVNKTGIFAKFAGVRKGFLRGVKNKAQITTGLRDLLACNKLAFSDMTAVFSDLSDEKVEAMIDGRIERNDDKLIDSLADIEKELNIEPQKDGVSENGQNANEEIPAKTDNLGDVPNGKEKLSLNGSKGTPSGKLSPEATSDDNEDGVAAAGANDNAHKSENAGDEANAGENANDNDGSNRDENVFDVPKAVYKFPPIDLLKDSHDDEDVRSENEQNAAEIAEAIRKKLETFGIEVTLDEQTIGPCYTLLSYNLDSKTPVAKISSVSSDLEMAARGGIRLLLPIPGTDKIGVEITNKRRSTIGVKEGIKTLSPVDENKLCFGFDIKREAFRKSPDSLPNLLIGGTTGSGKSVFLHSLIMQIAYNYAPQDIRLVLMDFKRVELAWYKKLPHLVKGEIIDEPEKASEMIEKLTAEMSKRYCLLEENSVRNISEYNELYPQRKLPMILVIIDEYADINQCDGAKLTESRIMQLMRKSRACGIHFVVATQRPSVEVIKGDIKANIPSRIAMKVPSNIDSRNILDASGAEKLSGKGDFLFSDGTVCRLQSPYVSPEEIKDVMKWIGENNKNE